MNSFQKSWRTVSKIVSKRPTVPSWGGVRMVMQTGRGYLAARTHEVFVKCNLASEWIPDCDLVLPLGAGDVLQSLDSFEVDVVDASVTFKAGGGKFRFQSVDSKDFGDFPEMEGESLQGDFSSASVVSYAGTTDDTKQSLRGVHFVNNECAATDGHRLSVCPATIALQRVTVPLSAIPLLQGMGVVNVRYNNNSLTAENDSMAAWIRLLDGGFPNYRMLFPSEAELGFQMMEIDDLIPVLNRSLSSGAVRCQVVCDGQGVTIVTQGASELFEEFVPTEVINPVTFYASPKYLLQAAKQFSGKVKMVGTGATKPFVMSAIDNPLLGEALIMPIMIR